MKQAYAFVPVFGLINYSSLFTIFCHEYDTLWCPSSILWQLSSPGGVLQLQDGSKQLPFQLLSVPFKLLISYWTNPPVRGSALIILIPHMRVDFLSDHFGLLLTPTALSKLQVALLNFPNLLGILVSFLDLCSILALSCDESFLPIIIQKFFPKFRKFPF